MDPINGYKHFTHAHNLTIHQVHEAAKLSCAGCNSLLTGAMFVCWPCNFYLHNQCFRATRSIKHPSHPSHPLTLVPYPTYPSNSFYCNSCKIAGSGLSYSCSDCEFDLHVRCAYSIPNAHQELNLYAQNQNTTMHAPNVGFISGEATSHNSIPVSMPKEGVASASASLNYEYSEAENKANLQRLEIAREKYRIEALGRQYCLDNI